LSLTEGAEKITPSPFKLSFASPAKVTPCEKSSVEKAKKIKIPT